MLRSTNDLMTCSTNHVPIIPQSLGKQTIWQMAAAWARGGGKVAFRVRHAISLPREVTLYFVLALSTLHRPLLHPRAYPWSHKDKILGGRAGGRYGRLEQFPAVICLRNSVAAVVTALKRRFATRRLKTLILCDDSWNIVIITAFQLNTSTYTCNI
jgi:hypothetical protein